MPVGHTHEDVDQMFSCIARALRKQNTYTYEGTILYFKKNQIAVCMPMQYACAGSVIT